MNPIDMVDGFYIVLMNQVSIEDPKNTIKKTCQAAGHVWNHTVSSSMSMGFMPANTWRANSMSSVHALLFSANHTGTYKLGESWN